MKLHLGCGQKYLDGYVNIDFPISSHSVQENSIADEFADIKKLSKANSEIEEIRLHHVFEHFNRPEACALVTAWSQWLKIDGILKIEVPDFTFTAFSILNPLSSYSRKMVGIRHLFGSHEADWAFHYEGYSTRHLKKLLQINGFSNLKIKRNSWKGTYNIEIKGRKTSTIILEEARESTKNFLRNFLVDASEVTLLEVWMRMYEDQLKSSLGLSK